MLFRSPKAEGIAASTGDKLIVTIHVAGDAEAWGTIDDVYLYSTEAYETYKINYILNGGTNNDQNPASYDKTQTVTFKNPTRSGYTFEGWYKDSGFTKQITLIEAGTTGEITVYAKWNKIEDNNGNKDTETKEVKVSKITLNKTQAGMKKGETLTLKAVVTPSKATNKAVKWSSSNKKVAAVDKNGKVKALQNGTATIKATAKDGSGVSASCKITVGYKITYKLGKGKNNDQNPEYYYNQKINLKAASKKGYAFKGWYTDSKYTKKITTIAKNSKKNITVYAKWEKVVVKKGAVKKVTALSGKKAKVTLQKVSSADGYEIVYSTDKKFKKNVKKETVTGTSKTLSKLSKGKTYYVKVRAYKKDSTGAKVYGSFSGAKKVKISK